jgi:hypothetical protein
MLWLAWHELAAEAAVVFVGISHIHRHFFVAGASRNVADGP